VRASPLYSATKRPSDALANDRHAHTMRRRIAQYRYSTEHLQRCEGVATATCCSRKGVHSGYVGALHTRHGHSNSSHSAAEASRCGRVTQGRHWLASLRARFSFCSPHATIPPRPSSSPPPAGAGSNSFAASTEASVYLYAQTVYRLKSQARVLPQVWHSMLLGAVVVALLAHCVVAVTPEPWNRTIEVPFTEQPK
jgi:hypothetical protein